MRVTVFSKQYDDKDKEPLGDNVDKVVDKDDFFGSDDIEEDLSDDDELIEDRKKSSGSGNTIREKVSKPKFWMKVLVMGTENCCLVLPQMTFSTN